MARLAHEEGMHLDVATGGELHVALAGRRARRAARAARQQQVRRRAAPRARPTASGRIVVDCFDELDRLERARAPRACPCRRCCCASRPGVEAHTHEFVQTGQDDSKFGFGSPAGARGRGGRARCRRRRAVELVGLHAHIGSQVFVADFFEQAVEVLAAVRRATTACPSCRSAAGSAWPTSRARRRRRITEWGDGRARRVRATPASTARVTAEPGRAIVAAAGVTLYTVGTIKEIPGIRTYVVGRRRHERQPAARALRQRLRGVPARAPSAPTAPARSRVVGKHCESGDVLVREAKVPADLAVGDILATPVTGAYGHSMGSNYNKVPAAGRGVRARRRGPPGRAPRDRTTTCSAARSTASPSRAEPDVDLTWSPSAGAGDPGEAPERCVGGDDRVPWSGSTRPGPSVEAGDGPVAGS